jgi:hypothetical protein
MRGILGSLAIPAVPGGRAIIPANPSAGAAAQQSGSHEQNSRAPRSV